MGCEVTRCLRADIRRVETPALEELLVSPSVAKASYAARHSKLHELSIATSLHAYIRIKDRVVTSKLSQCARSEV